MPVDTFSRPLAGDDFDADDDSQFRARYPRLADIYLDSPGGDLPEAGEAPR